MGLSVQSDEYFMELALKQAHEAFEQNEIPVGAVIQCEGKIIAKAHNQVETLNDSTAHAEILALTSAFNYFGAKYLPDCTLYVTLEPCVMCAGAIFWSQIGKLVVGAPDDKRGYSNYQVPLHPKTEVISGIRSEEASELVSQFFNEIRGRKHKG